MCGFTTIYWIQRTMAEIQVSVITASLNSLRTLKNTLQSVGIQSDIHCEHIIIDGGSTDGTVPFLEQTAIEGVQWISEADDGIADAMNKGAAMANGRWLFFLQADDCFQEADSLSVILREGECHRGDLIAAGIRLGDRSLLPVAAGTVGTGWPWFTRFKQPFRHQGLLVSRSAWKRVGPYDRQFSITMDFDWMLRAFFAGLSVTRVGRELARVGETGLSSPRRGPMLGKRLAEEQQARLKNASTSMWRFNYRLFWSLYRPYRSFLASRVSE